MKPVTVPIPKTFMGKRKASEADGQVGERIRAARHLANMSQTDLALQLGLTFQQVQKYEKGTNRVGSGRLIQIAKALNTPAATLLLGTEQGDKNASDLELMVTATIRNRHAIRLIRNFPKLTLEMQISVADMIEAMVNHLPAKLLPPKTYEE
jgi:transcriptional regulator with XRE-family HTH domain